MRRFAVDQAGGDAGLADVADARLRRLRRVGCNEVERQHARLRVAGAKRAHQRRADEAGRPGDQRLHARTA